MKRVISTAVFAALMVSGALYADSVAEVATKTKDAVANVAEKTKDVAASATESVAKAGTATEAKKSKMRIKAKIKGDIVKVKVSIPHPMLTYNQAKKKNLPVNFIQHITATVGDKVVYDASTSQFLSKNPLVKFSFKSNGTKKGDEIKITYVDHTGTYFDTKKIK